MTDSNPAPTRGLPPNRERLAQALGDRLDDWNALRETVIEIGATWKWAFSEATGAWSYRSYLSGDRFFVALSLIDGGFEVSLNLKADEWDAISAATPEERALFDRLKATALASDQDPAWVHVPASDPAAMSLLAKMLVVRARRVQKPRLKSKKKR
jgi:hypothetical protein